MGTIGGEMGCCCIVIPESWVAGKTFGSEGVPAILGPTWMESVGKDKIGFGPFDFGFRRRRCRSTKVTIPITTKTAPAPPMMPPSITPVFRFLCGVGFPVDTLAFIGSTEALKGLGQE
jgi:hypothetical protein